jgi:hypothetical protein
MFVIHCGKRAAVTRQLVAVQQLRPCVWYQGLCAIASSTDHSGTERKRGGKKGNSKRNSFLFVTSLFSRFFAVLVALLRAHCCLTITHTGRPPHKGRSSFLISLSISPPPPFPREERERERGFLQGREIYEQIVRCKGCIIVRIIRMTKKKGGACLVSFFFSFLCAALILLCAKTQTTTAVSMLVCIRSSSYSLPLPSAAFSYFFSL